MNQIKLGKFIADVRNERGMTQDELAERIGVSSGKVISKWECGNNMPDFETLIEISKALKITLFELSTCKRIDNPKLIDKIKKKFITYKDYIFETTKNKLIVIFSIILGLIFGFATIFTIDNYKTIKVYEFINNENEIKFRLKGNIFITSEEVFFNIINISNIEKDKSYLDIQASNIQYEILDNNNQRILLYNLYKNEIENNDKNLLKILQSASFSQKVKKEKMPKDSHLKLKIIYFDENNRVKEILINFEIEKIFENTL